MRVWRSRSQSGSGRRGPKRRRRRLRQVRQSRQPKGLRPLRPRRRSRPPLRSRRRPHRDRCLPRGRLQEPAGLRRRVRAPDRRRVRLLQPQFARGDRGRGPWGRPAEALVVRPGLIREPRDPVHPIREHRAAVRLDTARHAHTQARLDRGRVDQGRDRGQEVRLADMTAEGRRRLHVRVSPGRARRAQDLVPASLGRARASEARVRDLAARGRASAGAHRALWRPWWRSRRGDRPVVRRAGRPGRSVSRVWAPWKRSMSTTFWRR